MTDAEARFDQILASATADNGGKPTRAQRGDLRAIRRGAAPALRKRIDLLLGDDAVAEVDTSKFDVGMERGRKAVGTYPILGGDV